MAIQYVKGNVVDQLPTERTLLIHVCNIYDGFGSGVAGAIAKKYPKVKEKYHDWFRTTDTICKLQDGDIPFNLGKVQPVKVTDFMYIVNMLGQSYPGGETFQIGEKKIYLRPVRLDSIRECLYNVASIAAQHKCKVIGPKFASGLAGGNWVTEVEPLVNECLINNGIDVTIYEFEG